MVESVTSSAFSSDSQQPVGGFSIAASGAIAANIAQKTNVQPTLPLISDPSVPPVKFAFDNGPVPLDNFKSWLGLVSKLPPAGDNIFAWSGPRDKLEGTTTAISASMSKDSDLAKAAGPGADAVTAVGKDENGKYIVKTEIIADRIYYDENGKQRSSQEIETRASVAMAHEIYGNQTSYLKAIQEGKDISGLSRKELEVNAFQAGIDFIKRVQASPGFSGASKELQAAFGEALKREQEGLASWQNAPDR